MTPSTDNKAVPPPPRRQLHRREQRRRERDQHRRQRKRSRSGRCRSGSTIASGAVWVTPWNEPGEDQRRPELAERPAPRQRRRRSRARDRDRHRDPREGSRFRCAQRARRLEPARVERLERGLGLADVERARDEGQRHDHPGRLEDELLRRVLDQPADEASGPQRDQEPDACDGRRQDERQLDERDRESAAAEVVGSPAGRRPACRPAMITASAITEVTRLSRSASRALSSPERVPQLAGSRLQEDRGDRDGQEDERERQGAGQDRGEPAAGSATPLRRHELGVEQQPRAPAPSSRLSMNSCAPSGLSESETTATPYSTTGSSSARQLDRHELLARGVDVRGVDEPRVGRARRRACRRCSSRQAPRSEPCREITSLHRVGSLPRTSRV